jgi:hypothetical protein
MVRVDLSSLAERLRNQTSSLVDLLTRRIRELSGRERLVPCIRCSEAFDARSSFLKAGEYAAVGIDGSMDYDEVLEMLLFYVCATGFRCSFVVDKDISFRLKGVERDKRLAASASVPLWTEDLFQVTEEIGSTEFELERSADRIPFALMTMAELSLAVKAVEDESVRLLFLDRPLSGTFGPLARDLRLFLMRGKSVLLGKETTHGPLTLLDFRLASVLGSGSDWVPQRVQYLPYLAVQKLMKAGKLSGKELFEGLGLSEKRGKQLVRKLVRMHEASNEGLFVGDDLLGDDAVFALKEGVVDYWLRMKEAVSSVVGKVFHSSEHPLMLGEGESWLTVIDLNAINTMLVHLLKEKALNSEVLVVGVAKDTSASEFVRAVIPYAKVQGLIPEEERLPSLRHDRAFLTILSSTNPRLFKTPWRTLGYDACFTTMIEGDGGKTMRAARRTVSMERRFVRGYFQLRAFETDEEVRSPAFLYDRFYDPRTDDQFTVEMNVVERGKEAEIYPYWEGAGENRLDTFVLCLLSKCDNPEVLEAIGHNQLLYLADKAAKTEVKMMKGLLRGVADLELGTLSRRQKIFTIARRFRDIRKETEGAREKAVSESI